MNDSRANSSRALDPARIRELMTPSSLQWLARLDVLEETDSTNSALQRLPLEQQHAHAILAESQTSGRGRRKRNWHSPAGCNVYLSLGWRFDDQRLPFAAVPLVTAVCTCRALARAGLRGHGIKWPNDILVDDAKIAGILIELQAASGGPANAVIGVGVNVSMAQGEVERRAANASIDRSWTDLESKISHQDNGVSRNEVAAILLEELLAGVLEYQSTGFSTLRGEWSELDLLAGKEVRLDLQGKFTDGIARGISEDGALLLDVTGPDGRVEQQVIHAGEVSVHRD